MEGMQREGSRGKEAGGGGLVIHVRHESSSSTAEDLEIDDHHRSHSLKGSGDPQWLRAQGGPG